MSLPPYPKLYWHEGIAPEAPPRAPTKPRKRLREFSAMVDRIPEDTAPLSYQAITAFFEETGMKREELLQRAAWFEKKAKNFRLEALKQPWLCPAEIAPQMLASANAVQHSNSRNGRSGKTTLAHDCVVDCVQFRSIEFSAILCGVL